MVKVSGAASVAMNLIGLILLAVGAFGIFFTSSHNLTIQIFYMAAGIILIIASSVLIQMEGSRLRKEDNEYRRFEEIKMEARRVPNDLKDGYLIDYTADPCNAVSYRSNEPEPTQTDCGCRADEDVVIIYSN